MLQTPSIAGDNEDNVVLISGESNLANEWTKEQLKSLFEHFTNKNTTTNARLDVLDSRSQHIYATAASISPKGPRSSRSSPIRLSYISAESVRIVTTTSLLPNS